MQRLGPFQLLRRIGRGGMAEVWSAKRSAGGIEKFVAIKVLAPHLAEQQSYRDMFLAEARRSMMLHHPNIVHVIDAVDDPPDCYMVMELVEGLTLAQLERALGKQGETLPLSVSAFVIGELLKSLAYAHSISLDAGSILVHRDVSPQNVMVTARGEAKLMDFGIARFASEETQGNFVKGKLQYMPPEQLRKESRKPTIDLFAVGAILHELLDGRRFRGNLDQARLIGMVIQGEVPALQDGVVVPPELEHLRRGLLEADEERRIQSANDALQLLARWPGYHVATQELAELVQRYVKPASTSGHFVGFEDSQVVAKPRSGTMHDSSVGPHPQRELSSDSELRRVDPRAAADTQQSGLESTDASLELVSSLQPAPRLPPPAAREGLPRWFWAATAAMVVFASIGVFAAVQLARAKQQRQSTSAAANSEPTQPGEPAPTPAEPTPTEPTPTPSEPPPSEPPPSEPPPSEPPPSEPPPSEPLPSKAPPPPTEVGASEPAEAVKQLVWVEFVANEFYFVYVRVNGKILTLEPKSRIKLPVGAFTVYLRPDENSEWTKAGRITLDPDKEYRVEMKKPAGLQLVEVGA
jgi:serine/threonine-protein kinase